jgi:hypothetical protein
VRGLGVGAARGLDLDRGVSDAKAFVQDGANRRPCRLMVRAVRIDFFASGLMVDGAPVGNLSDHAALLAEITWSGSPKPARLAGSGP